MKILSLNIWAGRMEEELLEFISSISKEVDVFCFQEVYGNRTAEIKKGPREKSKNIYQKIQKSLEGFDSYFAPAQENDYGPAIFTRKNIKIVSQGEEFVYRWKNSLVDGDRKTLGKNIIYIQTENDYTILNFHGLWNEASKEDTPERIKQSEKINNLLKSLSGKKILCGDFNLSPNTESLKILEENLVNLISKYGIASTRSSFFEHPDRFADYILTSKDVGVKNFKVLPNEVSDHLPLLLEIEE